MTKMFPSDKTTMSCTGSLLRVYSIWSCFIVIIYFKSCCWFWCNWYYFLHKFILQKYKDIIIIITIIIIIIIIIIIYKYISIQQI